jgi:hypothetical protein
MGINKLPRLTSMSTKDEPRGVRRMVPVRCDKCYTRTELIRSAIGYNELWPEKAPNCKHPPVKKCPGMKKHL